MNMQFRTPVTLAISLVTFLTGCGTATLHEAWDSDLETRAEQTVPDNTTLSSHCAEIEENWDPEWTEFEMQVLELTNQRRAEGADCNTKGVFPPAGPLTWNRQLACAARAHSRDMAERDYVAHNSPEGTTPADRTENTGYDYLTVGENIAAGQWSPEMAVEGWMGSDGHCANLMRASYKELGVGYAQNPDTTYSFYWTQVFGNPFPTSNAF